ncbi:MAG: hypothetical protein RLY93_14655 [Sumerlaeia bacterium]
MSRPVPPQARWLFETDPPDAFEVRANDNGHVLIRSRARGGNLAVKAWVAAETLLFPNRPPYLTLRGTPQELAIKGRAASAIEDHIALKWRELDELAWGFDSHGPHMLMRQGGEERARLHVARFTLDEREWLKRTLWDAVRRFGAPRCQIAAVALGLAETFDPFIVFRGVERERQRTAGQPWRLYDFHDLDKSETDMAEHVATLDGVPLAYLVRREAADLDACLAFESVPLEADAALVLWSLADGRGGERLFDARARRLGELLTDLAARPWSALLLGTKSASRKEIARVRQHLRDRGARRIERASARPGRLRRLLVDLAREAEPSLYPERVGENATDWHG